MLESEAVLWDKSHADYKKNKEKHDALKRIADTFGISALVVQSKLNNIRSQFLREEKKILQKKCGVSSENYVSRWFLFDYLKFLSGSADIKNISHSKERRPAIVTEEEIVTIGEVQYTV